jgi:predicted DNA-binding protein
MGYIVEGVSRRPYSFRLTPDEYQRLLWLTEQLNTRSASATVRLVIERMIQDLEKGVDHE